MIGNGYALHAQRRRLLARLGEEQAAAAHLRHRLADQGRTARLPGAPGGGRQARPPQARPASSTCSRSPTRSAPASRCSTPRAASSAPRSRTTCASACIAHDYELVYSPHITKGDLFETSGHLQWYKEGMFPPMHLDEEHDDEGNITRQGQDYYLKPMNCPFHNLIFRARGRSYRELPLRLAEFGTVYRYEKSGTLQGLTRVRGLTQDDAHIYVTHDQVKDEITSQLDFVFETLRGYGLDRLLPRALDARPREVRRHRRAVGGSDRDPSRGRRRVGPRARRRPGRSGVLRPEDLRAGARRHRPHLAAVDGAARLQPARALRARVHRGRRHQASSRS